MDKLTIRQAVLADLDALASLFDGYRQSVYRAMGWQRDERFQVYHLALSR